MYVHPVPLLLQLNPLLPVFSTQLTESVPWDAVTVTPLFLSASVKKCLVVVLTPSLTVIPTAFAFSSQVTAVSQYKVLPSNFTPFFSNCGTPVPGKWILTEISPIFSTELSVPPKFISNVNDDVKSCALFAFSLNVAVSKPSEVISYVAISSPLIIILGFASPSE